MTNASSSCDNKVGDMKDWFDGGDATSFGNVCYKIGSYLGILNLFFILFAGIPSFIFGYVEGYGE